MPVRHASILLRDASFRHGRAVEVLDGIDLSIDPGWTGVVGANGAGKSTLLRLIAGELQPTAGTVQVTTAVPVVLCPQEVGDLSDDVRAMALDWSAVPAGLRSRLDLDVDDLDRWSSLSPGERKRWQIGTALTTEPDVLLLDEPTNHLDREARDLLIGVLADFSGVGLVVSHDRALLDALTQRTLRIVAPGQVELRPGGYSQARSQWEAERAHAQSLEYAARAEERRLQAVHADLRESRRRLEQDAARRRSQATANQPDAREAGRRIAAAKAEVAVARRVRQVGSRLGQAAASRPESVRAQVGGEVSLRHTGTPGRRWLAELRTDRVVVGRTALLLDLDLAVGRRDRIHLAGPNGAGKTTLLRSLVPPGDGIAWLPQELTAHDGARLVAELEALPPERRGRVLGTVALLGVEPARLLQTPCPSPGEARKLALAHLLVSDHELIVLDEPTNHLDLPSIERLQDALIEWPGALLLVTHDPELATATTDTTWQISEGRVTVA